MSQIARDQALTPKQVQGVARLAGFLYLVIALGAPFSQLFVRSLIVRDDAGAAAANILGSELLYRAGGAAQIVVVAADVALAILFYELLKPAGRIMAQTAAYFRLMHAAIYGVAAIFYFTPLIYLYGIADPAKVDLSGLDAGQLQALALASSRHHAVAEAIALVFFGVHLLLIGWLMVRSGLLPRVLGAVLMIAGGAYLLNSFAGFLAPPVQNMLFPWVLTPAIGELAVALWLTVMGVDTRRWEAARAAPS